MKTANQKTLLILGGLILSSATFVVFKNQAFKDFVENELNNFDIRAFYAVAGIMLASFAAYILRKLVVKDQNQKIQKNPEYLYSRHMHHRAVIKKTA